MAINYRVGNDALTHQEMDDNFAQLANLLEDFNVTGSITASDDITAFSDERIKENISEITNALETVYSIRGVSYTRTDTGKDSLGVLAQEVEAVIPQLVIENKEGIKTVNYNGIVGLLLAAVKELSEEIKKLKE